MSFGDNSDGGTHGHISNPNVKAVCADGTWGAAPWESRSLPKDFFYLTRESMDGGVYAQQFDSFYTFAV